MVYIRSIIVLLVLLIVSGHQTRAQEGEKKHYRISIQVEGLEDSVAYLGYYRGDKRYVLDTTTIENGKLVFEDDKDIKTGVYFLYSKSYTLDFLVDRSLDFSLKTKKKTTYPDLVIENSEDNEQFRAFQMIMIDHQQKMQALNASLDSASSTAADTIRVREEMSALNRTNTEKRDSLLNAFGDTFMSQILIMMGKSPELKIDTESPTLDQKKAQYNYYKEHFFDGLNFDSEGLIRAPNFYGKVKEYIDRVTFQNPDSIIASIDYILDKCKNNSELFRFWMGTFFQEYQNAKIMGMDKIFVHLSDNYYLNGKIEWADSTLLAELSKEMTFLRDNQIGLKAPQMYLSDTLGRSTNLYDIKSDYLVLFFYDPDCGHCKKKTPVLYDLYKKMDGDFDVAAITVNTEVEKWKNFIKKFDLNWINLGDPNYRSNFRVQYNVRSTPQVYILNRDKEIIAKKLDVEQIETFINDRKRIDKMTQ